MTKLGSNLAIIGFLSICLLKIYAYTFLNIVPHGFFSTGNDSDGYHAAAIGEASFAVNIWPTLLNGLYNIGLYDRQAVSVFLFVLSMTAIPFLFLSNIRLSSQKLRQGIARFSLIVIAFYPTIFIYTLDLYRDVFMYFILLLGVYTVKKMLESYLKLMVLFPLFCLFAYFMFLLRYYLGFAFFSSFFLLFLYSRTSSHQIIWLITYFLALVGLFSVGILDPLLLYRGVEGFSSGGSSMGIGLYGQDAVSFLGLYLFSLIGQLFGLYLINVPSVVFFVAESIPFLVAFVYVLYNSRYLTLFAKYLMVFFVVYATIWVLGNDNLGTALRIRVPNYLAIAICAFIIYQRKTLLSKVSENERMSILRGCQINTSGESKVCAS